MDKDGALSNKNLIKQFLKNGFFLIGAICFILYFYIGHLVLVPHMHQSTLFIYHHFEIVEILALIALSYFYSIKEDSEIDLKRNLTLSVSYLLGSIFVYCCFCLVMLGLAILMLPIIGLGTFVGIGIISNVSASGSWFLNVSILRFFYAFGTIFTVTTLIKAIKDLIQSKKNKTVTLKSIAKPIIILCIIPIFFSIYNLSINLMNHYGTSKTFDIGFDRNPIVLNNGISVWFEGNNLKFYDYDKRKTFSIAMPFERIPFTTLLPDNKILLISGKSSYLFDAQVKNFIQTEDTKNFIDGYSSVAILPNNKILFISDSGTNLQIFNEKTKTFYSTAKPILTMWKQQGIALKNNKVFLYGALKEGKEYYGRVQIYDVSTNKFYLPKNQPKLADRTSSILLKNGKVFVVENLEDKNSGPRERHQTYEIYDPIYNSFSPLINNYGENLEGPTLTMLNDGSVLIISHKRLNNYSMGSEGYTNETQIFYPNLQTFEQIENPNHKFTYGESKIVLKDGRVVFIIYNNIEIYDPIKKKFIVIGKTREPRRKSTLIPLNNGEILIYGGDANDNSNEKATVEVFNLKSIKQ